MYWGTEAYAEEEEEERVRAMQQLDARLRSQDHRRAELGEYIERLQVGHTTLLGPTGTRSFPLRDASRFVNDAV